MALLGVALLFYGRVSAEIYVTNYHALVRLMPTGPDIIQMGGYYTVGDGGGGDLYPLGTTMCTADSALIFQDGSGNCYQRVSPTNNVREWGAKCDVVVVRPTPTATVTWNPALVDTHMSHVQGALVVPVGLLPPPPSGHSPSGTVNPYPSPGQYITISQIGGPTLGLIIGEPDYVSYGGVASGNGTNISGSWSSFTSGGLPTPFPGLTYGVSDTLYVNPNVYLGP